MHFESDLSVEILDTEMLMERAQDGVSRTVQVLTADRPIRRGHGFRLQNGITNP